MVNIKEINIKNKIYYFFGDIIKILDFNANIIIDTKSYKHINMYYIRYVTKEDRKNVNTQSVILLYYFVDKVDAFIEESDGNKYLNFASSDNKKRSIKEIHRTLVWD